jgi:hypothetical protein
LYLTNEEVAKLRTVVEKVYLEASEILDSGAMNEQDFDGNLVDELEIFMQTLEAVRVEEKDLFAMAC